VVAATTTSGAIHRSERGAECAAADATRARRRFANAQAHHCISKGARTRQPSVVGERGSVERGPRASAFVHQATVISGGSVRPITPIVVSLLLASASLAVAQERPSG